MIRLRDRVQIGNPSASGDDPLGNPSGTINWDTAPIEPAEVNSVSAIENTLAQDTVVERWRLRLCPITVATSTSVIRWRGADYQIDGEVLPVTDDRSRINHHVAFLGRVHDPGSSPVVTPTGPARVGFAIVGSAQAA